MLEIVLIVFALVLFALAAVQVSSPKIGLVPAGLACCAAAWLVRLIPVALLALALSVPLHAQSRSMWPTTTMLSAVTTTVSSDAARPAGTKRTYQAYGETSAGAGSVTVSIEVANTSSTPGANDWVVAGTITLTLSTTRTADGFTTDAPWTWHRARVTAISGTNAAVTVVSGTGE